MAIPMFSNLALHFRADFCLVPLILMCMFFLPCCFLQSFIVIAVLLCNWHAANLALGVVFGNRVADNSTSAISVISVIWLNK